MKHLLRITNWSELEKVSLDDYGAMFEGLG